MREAMPARCTALVLLPLLSLLSGSGCAPVAVHTMADPDADFAGYSTFEVLPQGGATLADAAASRRLRVLDDPRLHDELRAAIASELVAKGLRPAPAGVEPDLVVGYQTATRNQAEVLPPVYGVGWRGRVHMRLPAQVHWYKEGTLVIDIVDAADRSLVWRGVGVGAMRDMHPGGPLKDAVREILRKFPPRD
jgi:hypothetical protein